MRPTRECAQVAASLLHVCCFAVIKSISGCVCIVYSGVLIISLMQVLNRLDRCILIVDTFYPQAWWELFPLFSAAYLQISSCIRSDLYSPIPKKAYRQFWPTCIKPLKSTTCIYNLWRFRLCSTRKSARKTVRVRAWIEYRSCPKYRRHVPVVNAPDVLVQSAVGIVLLCAIKIQWSRITR